MRHFSCEHCDGYVKGGFDPSTNQVFETLFLNLYSIYNL